MTLSEKLSEYIAACFPALWIQSYEHDDALADIARLCRDEGWRLASWDVDAGLQITSADEATTSDAGGGDPLAAIRSLGALASPETSSLLVLMNFHRFLGSAEVVQAVLRQIAAGKQSRTFLIVVSPVVDLPKELEKQFAVIEHQLPGRDELEEIARGTACEEGDMPEDDQLGLLLDAAAGMTRLEAENTFALSLVRHGRLDSRTVFEQKAQLLAKGNRALTLHEGQETFADIGGLDYLKTYCLETLSVREANPKFRPRGALIMGVSGSGKSLLAKALGREVGRPTLCFDVGATLGSLMGQSQSQFREALAKADAMAPAILYLDEIEKALSGAGHDSHTSGGVKTEMFGYFLTWLQEHQSDVFVIATCNDIRKIINDHPEFVRRFDQLFFVDFPNRQAKDRIWEIHLRGYELLSTDDRLSAVQLPDDENWTGSEIENCCRQARLRRKTVAEVGQTMPRIIDQAADVIEATRGWATGRCYAADCERLYEPPNRSSKSRRKIRLAPSDN